MTAGARRGGRRTGAFRDGAADRPLRRRAGRQAGGPPPMQLSLALDERAAVSRHRMGGAVVGPSTAATPPSPANDGADVERPTVPDSWRLDEHTRQIGLAGVAAARALLDPDHHGGRAA